MSDFVLSWVSSRAWTIHHATASLNATNLQAREDDQVAFLQRLLPRMAKKLRDRQPHLCPGGRYTNLTPTEKMSVSAVPATSDIIEGDLAT